MSGKRGLVVERALAVIPIVMLTARDDDTDIVKGLELAKLAPRPGGRELHAPTSGSMG